MSVQQPALPRLNKFLADSGIDSRRRVEELILQGRVTVDGECVQNLAVRVDPDRQSICVDGQKIRSERKVYYLLNKPKGYVCSNGVEDRGRRAIDLLSRVPQRIYTIGRLDKTSEGLMLLTNDGAFAHRLTHPRFMVEKSYLVQIRGRIEIPMLNKLRKGVWLSDGKMHPHRMRIKRFRGSITELEIVLTEGKNREIRRMFASVDYQVVNLRRTAFAGLKLSGLASGKSRKLTQEEIKRIHRIAYRKQS